MKRILCILILFVVLFTPHDAFATIIIAGHSQNKPPEKINITKGFKEFALTGDSYAGYFIDYEYDRKYKFKDFALAGSTIAQNRERIDKALSTIHPIVILSIGVNDCDQNTSLEKFTKDIESVIDLAKLYGKTIIMHTYMDYDAYHMDKKAHSPREYDQILKLEDEKNDNVYYIDMHDYEKTKYQQKDYLHYNKAFYDELYNRIEILIDKFKAVEAEQEDSEKETESESVNNN